MKAKKYCHRTSFTYHHPKTGLFWTIFETVERDSFREKIREQFMIKVLFARRTDQRPEYLLREAIKHEA